MAAHLNPPARCFWIVNGRFLAGAYPSDYEDADGRRRLQEFLNVGIDTFISLQPLGQKGMQGIPDEDYGPILRGLAATNGLDISFQRFPIRDSSVCSAQKLSQSLDEIDSLLHMGRRIYLHCWAGHGRTGLVVGCWLVRHGLSGREALERITQLRQCDSYLCDWSSPATAAQCDLVRRWHELDVSRKR